MVPTVLSNKTKCGKEVLVKKRYNAMFLHQMARCFFACKAKLGKHNGGSAQQVCY